MKQQKTILSLTFFIVLPFLFLSLTLTPSHAQAKTKCHLNFTMKSWSIFYKSGKGWGTIKCDNGQSSSISIRAHGGGLSFGKRQISGRGSFTKVDDISKLYGKYATSEAHAGVSGSAGAQVMNKKGVSLSLTGTGKGVNLGIALGSFKITPVAK